MKREFLKGHKKKEVGVPPQIIAITHYDLYYAVWGRGRPTSFSSFILLEI